MFFEKQILTIIYKQSIIMRLFKVQICFIVLIKGETNKKELLFRTMKLFYFLKIPIQLNAYSNLDKPILTEFSKINKAD